MKKYFQKIKQTFVKSAVSVQVLVIFIITFIFIKLYKFIVDLIQQEKNKKLQQDLLQNLPQTVKDSKDLSYVRSDIVRNNCDAIYKEIHESTIFIKTGYLFDLYDSFQNLSEVVLACQYYSKTYNFSLKADALDNLGWVVYKFSSLKKFIQDNLS